ncbi:hypothetical protein GW916_01740 [bacterium]|nr:hypothetical protein [bacterium]
MQKFFSVLALGFTISFSGSSTASAVRSDMPAGGADLSVLGYGIKDTAAIQSNWENLQGHNNMLKYVMPSPDQGGAGSCLYMALTGIAEWHLAKKNPRLAIRGDGALDLSERALMNLAGLQEENNGVENWKTDSILLFNQNDRGILNRDLRYTKGFHKYDDNLRRYVRANEGDANAEYGQSFNWINGVTRETRRGVVMPKFQRHVIFADPASNQWNVAVAPSNIAEQIKDRLDRYNAPVLLIYNHYGYWHAVGVYGYDEEAETDCSFVENNVKYFDARSKELYEEASRISDPARKKSKLALADKLRETGIKVDRDYHQAGGCNRRGVFYVRDSIYSDPSEAMYDFDLSRTGDEEHYSKRIILRSESFMRHMVNHVVQITAD